jgi:hypothetical protein
MMPKSYMTQLQDRIEAVSEARDNLDQTLSALETHLGCDLDDIDVPGDLVPEYDAESLIARRDR